MTDLVARRDESIDDVLVERVREQLGDDPMLDAFVRQYFVELPDVDVEQRTIDDLVDAVCEHIELGQRRPSGASLLEVTPAVRHVDGERRLRSQLMIVTDDVPFLVDSVRMVLERLDIAAHLLIHPTLLVSRTANGEIDTIGDPDGRQEAWTLIEIDRLGDDDAAALRADASLAVAAVHRVVADFEPMRSRLQQLASIDPLLGWLADGNFVLLGAATLAQVDGRWQPRDGTRLGRLALRNEVDPSFDPHGPAVQIARSSAVAMVHRPSRLTSFTVRHPDATVDRFVGLLAASAYRMSVLAIPTIGENAARALDLPAGGVTTHSERQRRNVLESLPRDVVFELSGEGLAELVADVVGLHERDIVRVFDVPEPVGSRSTVLAYFPRRRFRSELPDDIADAVGEAYGCTPTAVETYVGTSSLARVTFTVERGDEVPSGEQLADIVDRVTTGWADQLAAAAERRIGAEARSLLARFDAETSSPEYRSTVDPTIAVADLVAASTMIAERRTICAELVSGRDSPMWDVRVRSLDDPIALSELLPVFGHLGLVTVEERPYRISFDGRRVFVYALTVRPPDDLRVDDAQEAELLDAVVGLLLGDLQADDFNRLVLTAGITARQADVLRSYARYARQIGLAFSQAYVEQVLNRLPGFSRLLVELFEVRFDPDRFSDRDAREAEMAAVVDRLHAALDEVPSLDDDRIGRLFLALVMATVRTSAFQTDKPTLAFKFDPARVPDLPEPWPAHEIFVCSARVEGVHLRGGPIARGGLRWSDRPEDYRTEVLGLVKAQMVKNAVIVPVGSKGGFVVKRPPADPAQRFAEGVTCYRRFIGGLLDLTDNIVAGEIVPPARTVRYDGDDAYLVVAADKGTASFSDIANEVADQYDFWLGDAFASGGSAGYDHKAMGITARGAWESARRHASALGLDADRSPMTVVGIGDMSGDVFGNGMLMSEHLRLVAAFDHRHVFVDPDPDPAASYAERRRLFDTPRSTWAAYRSELISAGGGVFDRSAKSIAITPQMQRALGIGDLALTPNELISAILRAPVDLLWNGGVGTYVKASSESHDDIGDRANDAVRIDAVDLRCRMVVEGGNLGVSQLGRVEYALQNGLIYTDAIDNSAGVDCSDHEVNIKILLRAVMDHTSMTLAQRNELLAEMTDEVASLVLSNNRAQTLALLIARTQGLPMVNVHARYLDQLEAEGWLQREMEFLPSDKEIAARQAAGSGLRAPEFAVMIAYTKNANIVEILASDLPSSPVLDQDVIDYFPTPLRERFRREILEHRLRREIAATELVNEMTNLSGISFDHRMTEDTGATVVDITRAWLTVREILGFPDWWYEIGELEHLSLTDHLDLYLDCRRTAERCALWFLRHRRPPIDIVAERDRFRQPVLELASRFDTHLRGGMRDEALGLATGRVEQGVPPELAQRSSVWRLLHTTFDIVELADRCGVDPATAADAYWEVFDRLELMWLWEAVGSLPRADRWQTQARSSLRDDLLSVLTGVAGGVVTFGSYDEWAAANHRAIERTAGQLTQVRRTEHLDIASLSVALRQLRNLSTMSLHDIQ